MQLWKTLGLSLPGLTSISTKTTGPNLCGMYYYITKHTDQFLLTRRLFFYPPLASQIFVMLQSFIQAVLADTFQSSVIVSSLHPPRLIVCREFGINPGLSGIWPGASVTLQLLGDTRHLLSCRNNFRARQSGNSLPETLPCVVRWTEKADWNCTAAQWTQSGQIRPRNWGYWVL